MNATQGQQAGTAEDGQAVYLLPAGFRGFSRGDGAGNIVAGSASFQKLIVADWNTLIGHSHDALFSPQMPKGVLRLLQSKYRQRVFVFSYVRGITYGNGDYSGIILCVPLQEGYVTMLMNVSSPFYPQMQDLYARLSAQESAAALTDQDAEALFLRELAQMGFDSYDVMMWHAIWAEFQSEIAQQSTRNKLFFSIAQRVRSNLKLLKDLQAELLGTVALLRDLPTNMRIIASRLEPSGGPLSAMSDIYSTASTALFSEIVEFSTGATSLTGDMENAFGKACAMKICAILQDEVTQNFRNDPPTGAGFSLTEEFEALDRLHTICLNFESIGLYDAQKLAQKINSASYDLRRSMLGLDTVRVMGLVESGRMGAEGSRIGATMEQIGHCHDRIVVVLQKIKDTAAAINIGVTELRNSVKRKSALAAG